MAKKKVKVNKGLENSSDAKLKQVKKQPKPKSARIEDLSPKVKNKDSVTENIKSRSSKSISGDERGKIKRVPLSQKLNIKKKK